MILLNQSLKINFGALRMAMISNRSFQRDLELGMEGLFMRFVSDMDMSKEPPLGSNG